MNDQIAAALRIARNPMRYESLTPIAPVVESAPADPDCIDVQNDSKNADEQISAQMAADPDSGTRLAEVVSRGLEVAGRLR